MREITFNDLPNAIIQLFNKLESIEQILQNKGKDQNPNSDGDFITRKEAAKILGISLPTLHDWSKRGIIPTYRIATRIRYKRQEVEASLSKVQTIKYGRGL